jgi:type I restriction enzyme S subunit
MTTGVIQDQVRLEDSAEILLPTVDSTAQKYIGNKVRQAERLRFDAEGCQEQFDRAISAAYPEIGRQYGGSAKHSRAPVSLLDGSLNPGKFNPDRMLVREYLRQHGGKAIEHLAQVETPVTNNYGPNDKYIGLDSIGSSTGVITPSTITKEAVVGAVRVLTEGPVISKLRPYLNKVAYIPAALSGSLASTELLCVRPRDPSIGWYLYGGLKLKSTVRQLNPVSTGSTHPRVSREDIAEVVIPWIDDPVSVGSQLQRAQVANMAAERLTTVAKLLVESLIDGRINECEFVAAQQALERGDQSLDRAILSRLTVDGVDVVGKPALFPDLDALYTAIEESQDTDRGGPA